MIMGHETIFSKESGNENQIKRNLFFRHGIVLMISHSAKKEWIGNSHYHIIPKFNECDT